MKRYARNSLCAGVAVYSLLWLLTYQPSPSAAPDQVTVREVTTMRIKPPAAPPQTRRSQAEQQVVALTSVATAEQVTIKVSELDIELPDMLVPELSTTDTSAMVGQFQSLSNDDIVEDMLTFGLDELDERPRLLTRITAKLPRELQRQGIKQSRIILHVIIHESGRVELMSTEKIDYPILNNTVPEVIRQARFTSPIRYGKQVKAEFLWPIIITK